MNKRPSALVPVAAAAPLAEDRFPPALMPRRQREALQAENAKRLDGRVFKHRTTGEIRVASWEPECIRFFNPETEETFTRPHRKAIEWCQNADDVSSELARVQLPKGIDGAQPPECDSEGGEL